MSTTETSQRPPIASVGSGPREAADGCCEVYFVDEDRVGRVQDAMLEDDLVEQVADLFKVLAHPNRVRIVRALGREQLCVCDLARVLGMSISAVSHQLRTMRQLRLVRYRMDGKLAYYTLRDQFLLAVLEDGLRHLAGEVTHR